MQWNLYSVAPFDPGSEPNFEKLNLDPTPNGASVELGFKDDGFPIHHTTNHIPRRKFSLQNFLSQRIFQPLLNGPL